MSGYLHVSYVPDANELEQQEALFEACRVGDSNKVSSDHACACVGLYGLIFRRRYAYWAGIGLVCVLAHF